MRGRLNKMICALLTIALCFVIGLQSFADSGGQWSSKDQEIVKLKDDNSVGESFFRYSGKSKDGKFLVFDLDYEGIVYSYNAFRLPKPDAKGHWTHFLFHIDPELYSKINFNKSYAEGVSKDGKSNGKWHRLDRDYYDLTSNFSTDKCSYFIRLSQIFGEDETEIKAFEAKDETATSAKSRLATNENKSGKTIPKHKARVYLALKNGTELKEDSPYKIETRLARKARDTGWRFYLIRYQLHKFNGDIVNPKDYDIESSDSIKYNDYTRVYEFLTKGEAENVTNGEKNVQAYGNLRIDWRKNTLTSTYNFKGNVGKGDEFKQSLSDDFKGILRGKDGNKVQNIDVKYAINGNKAFSSQKNLSLSSDNPEADVSFEIKNDSNEELNIDDRQSIEVVYTLYKDDMDSLRKAIIIGKDISVTSRLKSKGKLNDMVVVKNSQVKTTSNSITKTKDSPLVDDVYAVNDNVSITPNGESETPSRGNEEPSREKKVSNKVKNTVKGRTNTKDYNPDVDVVLNPKAEEPSFYFNESDTETANDREFNVDVYKELKKDDRIVVTNTDKNSNLSPSLPTTRKVKAKVNFYKKVNKHSGTNKPVSETSDKMELIKSVDAPANEKYRDEVGYTPNAFGNNMPVEPVEGIKKFKGWITSKDYTGDYDSLPELKSEDDWKNVDKYSSKDSNEKSQDKVYRFTRNSPVDKNRSVYAVWESESDSIDIILHENSGTKDKKKLVKVNYGDVADYYDLSGVSTFDDQREVANTKYPNAILPDMYTYKLKKAGDNSKVEKQEFYKEGYTFVGWSTYKDNAGTPIDGYYEDVEGQPGETKHHDGLIENMAVLSSKEDRDGKNEFYLTTVEAHGKAFTDRVTKRRKMQRVEPKNGEIHLYAAWKPEYKIVVDDDNWFTKPVNSGNNQNNNHSIKTIRDWLNEIVHNFKPGTSDYDKYIQYKTERKGIVVGLLYRTAVTEAEKPTVTGEANYYTIRDSLVYNTEKEKDNYKERKFDNNGNLKNAGIITDIPNATGDKKSVIEWKYPGFDEHGKRISYVAVELSPNDNPEDKYKTFNQLWSNVWATIGENLGKPDRWAQDTIAKTQLLVLNRREQSKDVGLNEEVDSYTGATVREWKDNNKEIQIGNKKETRQKPTVGSEGGYKIDLYNIKSTLQSPEIRTAFGGDNYFYLEDIKDNEVYAIELKLPEHIYRPVYIMKDGEEEVMVEKYGKDNELIQEEYKKDGKSVTRPKWVVARRTGKDGNSGPFEKVDNSILTKKNKTDYEKVLASVYKRVKVKNVIYNDRNLIKVRVLDPGGLDFKSKEDREKGADRYVYFKIGQYLQATAYNKTGDQHSLTSITQLVSRGNAGHVRGLQQKANEVIDGKTYVVFEADRPTEDLGLLSDSAMTYLIYDISTDGENTVTPKNVENFYVLDNDISKQDKRILGKREGNKFVYKVPIEVFEKELNKNVGVSGKNRENVNVWNVDPGKLPVTTTTSVRVDIVGPKLNVEGDSIELEENISTNKFYKIDKMSIDGEPERIEIFDDKLTRPDGVSAEDVPDNAIVLTQSSDNKKIEVRANIAKAGKYTYTFKIRDRFGNVSKDKNKKEIEYKIKFNVNEVSTKETLNFEVVQSKKDGDNYIFEVKNKTEQDKIPANSRIRVYPIEEGQSENEDNQKPIIDEIISDEVKKYSIRIPVAFKQRIGNGIRVVLKEKDKQERTVELNKSQIHVSDPIAVEVDKNNPSVKNQKLNLTIKDENIVRIDIKTIGSDITLEKKTDGWYKGEVKAETINGEQVGNGQSSVDTKNKNYAKISVDTGKIINPNERIVITAYDKYDNATVTIEYMGDIVKPFKPLSVFAILTDENSSSVKIYGRLMLKDSFETLKKELKEKYGNEAETKYNEYKLRIYYKDTNEKETLVDERPFKDFEGDGEYSMEYTKDSLGKKGINLKRTDTIIARVISEKEIESDNMSTTIILDKNGNLIDDEEDKNKKEKEEYEKNQFDELLRNFEVNTTNTKKGGKNKKPTVDDDGNINFEFRVKRKPEGWTFLAKNADGYIVTDFDTKVEDGWTVYSGQLFTDFPKEFDDDVIEISVYNGKTPVYTKETEGGKETIKPLIYKIFCEGSGTGQ